MTVSYDTMPDELRRVVLTGSRDAAVEAVIAMIVGENYEPLTPAQARAIVRHVRNVRRDSTPGSE